MIEKGQLLHMPREQREKRNQDDATPLIVDEVQFGVGFEAVIIQLLSLFSHSVNFQWLSQVLSTPETRLLSVLKEIIY